MLQSTKKNYYVYVTSFNTNLHDDLDYIYLKQTKITNEAHKIILYILVQKKKYKLSVAVSE